MAGSRGFSFPVLKSVDILLLLGDMGVTCSEDDLKNPTPLGVARLYEAMLNYMLGAAAPAYFEAARQPGFEVLQRLEHPEIHMDAVQAVGFYRIVARVMNKCGMDTFSVRDLIKPDARELRRALSALINFAKFREEHIGLYDELTQKADELDDQRQLVRQRHIELEGRVNALRMLRAEQEPHVAQSRTSNDQLGQTLRESLRRKEAKSAEIDALKEEQARVAGDSASVTQQMQAARAEIQRLRSRIVENPERLKQTILEMSNSLAAEKMTLVDLERRKRDMANHNDIRALLGADMTPNAGLVAECEAERAARDQVQAKLSSKDEEIARTHAASREAGVKAKHLARQESTLSEKSDRLQRVGTAKSGAVEKRTKEMSAEYDELVKTRDSAKAEVDKERKAAEELVNKVADLRSSYAKEVAMCEHEVAKLRAKHDALAREFVAVLAEVEGSLR